MTDCKTDICATRTALLETAEELFLSRGFDAVSIREITETAGANVAAVNYHFNGKTELYRACLQKWFAAVARQRIAVIERVARQDTPPQLRDIIEAYVQSNLKAMLQDPEGDHLLQIIYREMSPSAVAGDLVTDVLIAPIHQALQQAISLARPDLSDRFVSRCISSLAGQILHFIRFREVIKTFVESSSEAAYLDEVTRHITSFSLRGMESQ